MKAYNVYLNGRKIDTIFCGNNSNREDVRLSLINHDGYNPGISVRTDWKHSTLDSEKNEWRKQLVGKLRAEGAKDLDDETLDRVLSPCVCGTQCVKIAKKLRNDGFLTVEMLWE